MTEQPAAESERAEAEGDDQRPYPFGYGHGRLPLFMKIAWVGFLVFATWYIVSFLIDAAGKELS